MNPHHLDLNFTQRQTKAWGRLQSQEVDCLLYGGAKGGGKSYFLVAYIYLFALWCVYTFKLPETKNVPHVAWMGRKQSVDFTATTLQTWQMVIPNGCYVIRGATEKNPKHILIANRVAIDFGGLDKQESINKFNSAEYGMIAIDQAEETNKDVVAVLRGSLRMKIDGKELPYKELYTANPGQCWLLDDFISRPLPGHEFIQALPSDNPHLPKNYIETLKRAFKHKPELLEAYLHGSWDAFEGADQCIKASWVRESIDRTLHQHVVRRFLSCDVAEMGDDETIIIYFEETNPAFFKAYGKKTPMETANILHVMAISRGIPVIVVDAVGQEGLASRLEEMAGGQYIVVRHKGSYKPRTVKHQEIYRNRRAEAHNMVAQLFAAGDIDMTIPDDPGQADHFNTMCKQLYWATYLYKNGKMQITAKEKIKQKMGRSPDYSDAFIQGVYELQYLPNSLFVKAQDDVAKRHRTNRSRRVDFMAV